MTIADYAVAHVEPLPADLLRIEEEPGVEYVDGRIVEHSMSKESVRVATRIARLLGNADPDERLVEVYGDSLAYRCFPDDPSRFRKPDVSVVTKARLAEAGIVGDIGVMPLRPDLAVEVVSPDDNAYELAVKVEEYIAAGFPQVWVAMPPTRTVTVHVADGATELRREDEILVGHALPAFRCKVSDFFR